MREILFNSNATPIRSHGDVGYACCFCKEQCSDPADLKVHTIKNHDENSIKQVIKKLRVYTVKLDITDLKCANCQNDIPSIEKLVDHLIHEHRCVIYRDIMNHMVPFKFHGDELKCAICLEKFNNFRFLTEHMNNHFRNYICDVCGAGFVNRDILRSHLRIHKIGLYDCDFCSKTFNTRVKKQSHIKVVHRKLYMTRKCGYCKEMFDDYHKKNKHLVEFHGVNITVSKCNLCDKSFSNYQGLSKHKKRDHLFTKNYECDECEMKFCVKKDLNRHMLKHSEERDLPESIDIETIEEKNISKVGRHIKTEDPTQIKKKIKTKKIKLKPIKELSKHHHNIKEILQWSNTTPIHGRSDLGYLCCYCTEKFPVPADLKNHTLQLHKNDPNPKFLQKRDLKKYHVKVDITGLQCDICKMNIQNIEDLIDHLRRNHEKKIYTDIKNHVVGFKFEGSNSNELKCAICSNVYTKFKMLFEHMHKHSRNYICDECGSGFINNRALLNHQKRHNLGEFKCEHCEKVFDNLYKKNSHVTTVHVHGYLINKCGYCNQKFAGYRTKAEHLRTAHGITERAKCQACEKSFSTKDSLNKHIKRHHLMDNRYSCTLCDMKFHANKSLEEHMVKHTKTRSFQCRVCFKRYGRQQTLKEHMRIHDNDRRFKCEHCVMAFVQKCSWRRHMQAKHDDQI
ncbi:unnamed protein product [Euphydryas editha]|uniref:C2H2-type domain-containing protein n=1 Tax=Euphydryas editha TaxID=104508 RepID=A0AAU9URV1_EUPED|nr:unnamed protein product [Euphydryas editha]